MDMKRYFLSKCSQFILASFLCLISFYINAEEQKNNTLNQQLQKKLDENRAKYHLPAISLSIKLPNSSEINNYVIGNYSLVSYRKISPQTLFQIGSITKTFTASIVFKLIEENKLNIQDNLGKLLPEYPRWKNITIYDLLHHTSGVYNYTSGKLFDRMLRKRPYKNWTLKQLANLAYKHPDLYSPGTKYNYSNTDYILLGLVIEKVTSSSIQQVFNDYIKRFQLTMSFYTPLKYPNSVIKNIAHGYNRDGSFKINTDVTYNSMSYSQSAGAMISTPNDLVKWLIALFSGEIINKKSLEEMAKILSQEDAKPINLGALRSSSFTSQTKLFNELGIGAGIDLVYFNNGTLAWVHSGETLGYESFYAYSPCSGVYLALAYSTKPKKQYTFIEIADDILKEINSSAEAMQAIKKYQQENKLPDYCK